MPAPKGHLPYNKNGEGGRPKRYTDDYVNQLADHLRDWIERDKENIFIEDWCLENDIPEDAIAKELTKFERFSRVYSKLKTKQKVSLIKGGLKRKYLHNMCALILSNNHGIYQKTEQKISGDVSNPLSCIINDIDGRTKDLVR